MAATRQHRRRPKPSKRRALELLAGAGPAGFPSNMLIAHGFTIADVVELVRTGSCTQFDPLGG